MCRLDDMMDEVGMDQTMLLEFTHFGMKATCIRSLAFEDFRAEFHVLCRSCALFYLVSMLQSSALPVV